MSILPSLDIPIGGQWRQGQGDFYESLYPANGSVGSCLHTASVADVEEAVASADSAWRMRGWYDAPAKRAQVLHRIAQLIREEAEQLAQLQRIDNGKPISETHALVASSAATFQYFGALAEAHQDHLPASRGTYLTLAQSEPLGVVAAITPWNSPIASEAQKIAPALAAGNAVVLKPAECTPRMALALADIAQRAGLPAGLLSVVPGRGSVLGNALVEQAAVKKVCFTGSTEVGRRLAIQTGQRLISSSLELGGKSATIVRQDAVLDQAVNGIMFGIFSSSGESCIAGSRLFVHASLYEQLLSRLVAKTKLLRVADPALENTQMGPLIHMQHRAQVARMVQQALDDGGELLCGGEAPVGAEFDAGSYYLPTIISGLDNNSRLCQEEVFGPVLAVLPYDDEEQLIDQANHSVYGLAAGIWSRDHQASLKLAERLQVGTVWINTYKQFCISAPFSGWGDSGLGFEKGVDSLMQYRRRKTVFLGLTSDPISWAD